MFFYSSSFIPLAAFSALVFTATNAIAAPANLNSTAALRATVQGVERLNVRAAPQAGVVDQLNIGDEVSMTQCINGWCEVAYDSFDGQRLTQRVGFVVQSYLHALPLSPIDKGLALDGSCDLDCIIKTTANR